MGWWVGKVTDDCENGFHETRVIWTEKPSDADRVVICNGRKPGDCNVVGFHSFREAYRFTAKRKRALEFDRAQTI